MSGEGIGDKRDEENTWKKERERKEEFSFNRTVFPLDKDLSPLPLRTDLL